MIIFKIGVCLLGHTVKTGSGWRLFKKTSRELGPALVHDVYGASVEKVFLGKKFVKVLLLPIVM